MTQGKKLYLTRENAKELINLRKELFEEYKSLSLKDEEQLIEEMCKVPLGTLY